MCMVFTLIHNQTTIKNYCLIFALNAVAYAAPSAHDAPLLRSTMVWSSKAGMCEYHYDVIHSNVLSSI